MALAASASRPPPLLASALSSDRTTGASKGLESFVVIVGGPLLVTRGAKATIRTELANDPGFTRVTYTYNASHYLVSSRTIDPLSSSPGTVFRLNRSRVSPNHGQQQATAHGIALVNASRSPAARVFRTADF